MRNILLKVKNGTKSEKRISEIFKKNKIKFKYRQRIGKYEIDFVIGRVALEIDGSVHKHIDQQRDTFLFSRGYVPLHINAYQDLEAVENELLLLIKNNNYLLCPEMN